MKRFLLVPTLGLAAMALAAPARAQFPSWGTSTRYEDRASYGDSRRAAYDNGFREGIKQGEKDARKGEAFRFEDERTFQHADKGYHRSYGDRERYRQSFRSGYANGYSDGYQRVSGTYNRGGWGRGGRAIPRQYPYPSQRPYPNTYPNYPGYPNGYPDTYPRGGGYYSPAFDNGRNDGYQKGVEDSRKNRSFDPLRHKWYRSADREYRREYGPRDQYQDGYRRGFQEGYDQGYREGRYRY